MILVATAIVNGQSHARHAYVHAFDAWPALQIFIASIIGPTYYLGVGNDMRHSPHPTKRESNTMLTFGEFQVDESALSPAVTQRLLTSAFAHIMSNEAASHVVGQIRTKIAGKDGKRSDVTTEMVKAFRADEANAKVIEGWEDDFRKAKVASMLDGTLAVRVARAPTRDPVEAIMRSIAKMEVTAVLKANGVGFPKKDDTVTLPNGDEVDGDTLVDRRLAHVEHGPRIRQAAERKHREDQRLRDAAAKAAVGGGLADLAA